MILGYKDLLNEWKTGNIRFDPDIQERQIGLSSIDLRLGYLFSKHKDAPGLTIDPMAEDFDPSPHVVSEDFEQTGPMGQERSFILEPNQFVLARTLEKIYLPFTLAAQVQGRSTFARAGLSIHATAPHIHPGFRGPITLELHNIGKWKLDLKPGKTLISQVIFNTLKTRVSKKEAISLGSYLDQTQPFPKRTVGRKGKMHG